MSQKATKYKMAAALDFLLIVLILIFGKQPTQILISPFASSLQSIYSVAQHKTTTETFAFVPGLAQNKFSKIELEGLTALSFFDVPLIEEGINYDSRGYNSFKSDETAELFERARYNNVAIFMTISAWETDIILPLLQNSEAQQKLATQVIEEIKESEIDGVTVDFEYPLGGGSEYQSQFTSLIRALNERLNAEIPDAQVAVAIPSNFVNNESLYDSKDLSKNSDRIFIIASDFIVPEVKNTNPANPLYGYKENEYWDKVSSILGTFSERVSLDKIALERAWYGNGDNYPLYTPTGKPVDEEEKEPSHVFLDKEAVDRLAAGVPAKGREAARRNIPLIGKALEEEGILDSNVLAYALATIEHETDETFEPLEEIQGRFSARRLGYEGGMNYFGRGFIQLTHLRNYKMVGERIGLGESLVKHPELASDPVIAAKILAAFFKDNNVANLASTGNFIAARRPVNPDRNGRNIAWMAQKYEID